MGGGDWVNQEQQIQKAYIQKKDKTVAEPCEDLFEGIKVDALDKLYIQTRTVMDSWIIWALILIGILTVLPAFLSKFGVKMQSPFARRSSDVRGRDKKDN